MRHYIRDGGCTEEELKWYSSSPNYLRSYARGSHYGCDAHCEYYIYWMFIGLYAETNPSWSSFGSEQVNGWKAWNNDSNPDIGSPWQWSFNFPNGTGYYEFYSIGAKNDVVESAPGSADARCQYGSQSKIKNTGSYDIKGYLLIQVQYYNTSNSTWVVADDTVNETTPRIINSSEQLALDTIFNGLVNTSNFQRMGNIWHKIYRNTAVNSWTANGCVD